MPKVPKYPGQGLTNALDKNKNYLLAEDVLGTRGLPEYPYLNAPAPVTNKAIEASLADGVIWESFQSPSIFPSMMTRPVAQLRMAMNQARRYKLDEGMSAFLADLATRPFRKNTEERLRTLDSMRHSSRLPFPKTWVEFNNHSFRTRLFEVAESTHDVWNAPLEKDLSKVFKNVGWLLEEDPRYPSIIHISYFLEEENRVITPPFSFVYNTIDQDFPDSMNADCMAGSFAHGLMGHYTGRVGIIMEVKTNPKDWIVVTEDKTPELAEARADEMENDDSQMGPDDFKVHRLVPEFGGIVRYVFAFLSTLTDSPVSYAEVKPSRGYMAKGNYKQFLSHSVLRLNLPKDRNFKTLAEKILRLSRIGGHEVQAHWRTYDRDRGPVCSRADHRWPEAVDGKAQCLKCNATRTWIELPHGRGDWSIACKTKTYSVGHHGD